jgi:hypothetical protein
MEYADKLLDLLDRPGLPNKLSTAWVSRQLGVDWRTVGHRLLKRKSVQQQLPRLGWRYESCRGRPGSLFVRMGRGMTVGEIFDLSDKLIAALADPDPPLHPDQLCAVMGIPWRNINKQLLNLPSVRDAIEAAGLKAHPDGDGLLKQETNNRVTMTKIEETISLPTTLPDGSINMDKVRKLAALTPDDCLAATDLRARSGAAVAAVHHVKQQARRGVTYDQLNNDRQ